MRILPYPIEATLLILFIPLLLPFHSIAQDQSDCIDPTLLKLPFDGTNEAADSVRNAEYGKADRFTYWYRIEAMKGDSLDILISSTDSNDIYDASLYRYDGDRICEKVVYGDLEPIGIASLQGTAPEDRTRGYHPVGFQDLVIEKGGSYFLSVSRVGGRGCGHIARFTSTDREVEVRTKARECFKIPEMPKKEKKPEPVTLKLAITDSADGALIPGELMIMDRRTGRKSFIEFGGDSARTLQVQKGTVYRIKGEAVGYREGMVQKSFRSDTSVRLGLQRMQKGERMVLRRIYFHPNTYAFRDQSWTTLEALYDFLEKNPGLRIEIQGHTASDRTIEEPSPLYRAKGKEWNFTGTAEELSLLRAKAVKEELMAKGIDEERLRTKGLGAEEKLIEDPETRRQEQKNMRVEVVILE